MFAKKHCVFGILLFLILFSCEESLPTREDPNVEFEIILEVNGGDLETWPGTPEYIEQRFQTQGVYFVFKIINHFDEVLEGDYFFNGFIDISVADRPTLVKRLEFTYEKEAYVILIPEIPYPVGVEWNHRLDDGLYLWDYYIDKGLPVTIPLKAKGEIQIYKKFQYFETTEVEFSITYKK